MKSNHTLCIFTAIAALAALSATAMADSVMKPGAWEMRTKITATDATTSESKEVNESISKLCLSKAFLDKDPYLTPGFDMEKMKRKNAQCSTSDETRNGNSVSWKMACTLADGVAIDATIDNAASERKLKSSMKVVSKRAQSDPTTVVLTMDGAFIGKCAKEMPSL